LPAYFNNNPEHIAIIGRLKEYIKEDIKENPNMPSLSSIRYTTWRKGDNTAITASDIK
tara:strand:- start:214 stop:387 length:174 start_codon:yes stop_codon:yes gene_type:complete